MNKQAGGRAAHPIAWVEIASGYLKAAGKVCPVPEQLSVKELAEYLRLSQNEPESLPPYKPPVTDSHDLSMQMVAMDLLGVAIEVAGKSMLISGDASHWPAESALCRKIGHDFTKLFSELEANGYLPDIRFTDQEIAHARDLMTHWFRDRQFRYPERAGEIDPEGKVETHTAPAHALISSAAEKIVKAAKHKASQRLNR